MKFRRFVAALCTLLIIFSLVGCSSSAPQGNETDTQAVRDAVEKFSACKSVRIFQLTESEETVIDGDSRDIYTGTTEMELLLISVPVPQLMASSTTVIENQGEFISSTNTSYIVPENGGYTEYVTDGSAWYKFSVDQSDALSGLNAGAVAATFFTNIILFEKSGEETVNGFNALRYDGALGGEDLVGMLEANGQLSSLSSMSENQQKKIRENLLKDLEPVTVSVWLDKESGYPVRFQVSLTKVLGQLETSISKSLGNKSSSASITAYVITMDAMDFDTLTEIVLPPETATAQLLELE